MKKKILSLGVLSTLIVGISACSSENNDINEVKAVNDISSMSQRPDGNFNVSCNDGSTEIVSPDDILNNRVCGGSSGSIIYIF